MEREFEETSEALCSFVRRCPSPFHTVRAVCERLDAAGFTGLAEADSWHLRRGGSYYVARDGSSILAFRIGSDVDVARFQVCSSHSDSPTFKLKNHAELMGPGSYLRLNVEGYGGVIDRTWMDRPLSVAGRVMVEDGGRIRSMLFAPDQDLLVIPSVAVHLDRKVNSEGALRRNVDLYPLFSAGRAKEGSFVDLVARELGVGRERIVSHDLVLVNRERPRVWGAEGEFVSAPRLDDLQCAYAALEAFLATSNDGAVTVYACFDNEEVGSGTAHGALSTFLPATLRRICQALGSDDALYNQALATSFLVSCDNAHAVHPNHPELYDEGNRAWLNEGVVVKESAMQRYTTSAPSRALFESLCRRAGVPTQSFANRSDMPGGSTLGNLLVRQASMRSVDVGCPQLAMHSSYETVGAFDTLYMSRALRAFFGATFAFAGDGSVAFL